MSSAFDSSYHDQLPHFQKHWRAAGFGRLERGGKCSHTPPLLGDRPTKGTNPTHGLETPPQDGQDMHGIHGNPLLDPNVGCQPYQRVPVVASNAPPYAPVGTTVDHERAFNGRQPFYNSYYSARRPDSPVLPPKQQATESEHTARKRTSSDGNSIASHLQIPSTINDSKGSLPEFAAQVCKYIIFTFYIHFDANVLRLPAFFGLSLRTLFISSKKQLQAPPQSPLSCRKHRQPLVFENG